MTAPTATASDAAAVDATVRTDDGAALSVTVLAPLGAVTATSVLLAHGWAASSRVWGTVADRLLRTGHRVITYDQRGHGRSMPGEEPISVERLGRDMAHVLGAVDTGDGCVVVGHSGGGFAALAHGVAGPPASGAVTGLVLLNTAAHGQDTSESEVRMMGSTLFSRALSQPPLGRLLLRQTMGPSPDRRLLEVNRQMFASAPAEVRAECFRCTRDMDLRADLAAVTTPAVVLCGADDRVVAPELGHALANALPEAEVRTLPGVGHMSPLEAPEEVVQAVAAVEAAALRR